MCNKLYFDCYHPLICSWAPTCNPLLHPANIVWNLPNLPSLSFISLNTCIQCVDNNLRSPQSISNPWPQLPLNPAGHPPVLNLLTDTLGVFFFAILACALWCWCELRQIIDSENLLKSKHSFFDLTTSLANISHATPRSSSTTSESICP